MNIKNYTTGDILLDNSGHCAILQIMKLYDPETVHDSNLNCSLNTTFPIKSNSSFYYLDKTEVGHAIFAFVTPFIIILGIFGNGISLKIFCARTLKHLSATQYLIAIAISDMMALLTGIFILWLEDGLIKWPGQHVISLTKIQGVCQLHFYMLYLSRFMSVWLIVMYTIERYVAVCHPLKKHVMCSKPAAHKIIFLTFICGCLICLFKPIFSGVHINEFSKAKVCSSLPKYAMVSFILDSIYALLISVVPFIPVLICNVFVLRGLLRRHRKGTVSNNRILSISRLSREKRMNTEFTLIMVVISLTYLLLNIPYFVVWFQKFITTTRQMSSRLSDLETAEQVLERPSVGNRDVLYITKTIFYMTYSINFCLYTFTGRQYRLILGKLFKKKQTSFESTEVSATMEMTRLSSRRAVKQMSSV